MSSPDLVTELVLLQAADEALSDAAVETATKLLDDGSLDLGVRMGAAWALKLGGRLTDSVFATIAQYVSTATDK
jgi:hypothetical protein